MTLKQDVLELSDRHPDWSSARLAQFLDAAPSSVRGVRSKARLFPQTALSVKRQPKLRRKVKYAGWSGEKEW